MATMKAVRVNEWGQPVTVEEIEQPAAGPGEVLVRVRAAGVNKVDYFIAAGYLQGMLSVPMTLGTDFAGDVVEVGADVTHVQPGDAVYGLITMKGGAFAEYVVAQAGQVAPKPQSLDYVQAAGVPLVALTAWQSVFDTAGVQAGERVLVHGAAGGVGSFATQFAKNAGAYVIAAAGAEKAERLQELGVDEHVDSGAQPFEEVVQQVDVVVDTVSGDVTPRSYGVIKRGGRLATVGQISPEEAASQQQERGIQVAGVFTQPNVEQLTQVARLIDEGKVTVFVSNTFPLEQVQQALELVAGGHPGGKVVLNVS